MFITAIHVPQNHAINARFYASKNAHIDYQALTVKCEVNFEKHFIFCKLQVLTTSLR